VYSSKNSDSDNTYKSQLYVGVQQATETDVDVGYPCSRCTWFRYVHQSCVTRITWLARGYRSLNIVLSVLTNWPLTVSIHKLGHRRSSHTAINRICRHLSSSSSFNWAHLWGHSGPLCHALSLSSSSSSSSSWSWTSMRRRRATVAASDTWWMGVRRLAVANGPNIFHFVKSREQCNTRNAENRQESRGYVNSTYSDPNNKNNPGWKQQLDEVP